MFFNCIKCKNNYNTCRRFEASLINNTKAPEDKIHPSFQPYFEVYPSIVFSYEPFLSSFVARSLCHWPYLQVTLKCHIFIGICDSSHAWNSFIVRTHDARTYHGHCNLSFTVRTRVMLVYTIAYCQCWACSGLPQLS